MRLIDADALRESIITRQTEMSYEDAWALTCVDNAPTIEPQKWIPVKERLPEDGETVLVQFDDGNMDILTFPNIYKRLNRVAWMPLPPAYKEEEE